MSARLSAVIPAYQAECTIRRCLESVLAVRELDIEAIVVDDGSTDGTLGICEEMARADARVHVISQVNRGRCAARNVGIEASRGEWLAFVDADDRVVPEGLLESVRLGDCSGHDVVQAAYGPSYHSATRCERFSGDELVRFIALNGQCNSACANWEGCDSVMFRSVWGKCYRREAIGDTRFVEGLRFGEDALFNIACLPGNGVLCADCVVYDYRLDEGGTCASYRHDDFACLEALHGAARPLFLSQGYGEKALREFVGLDAYYRMQQAAACRVSTVALLQDLAECAHVSQCLMSLFSAKTPLSPYNRPALWMLAHGDVAGAYRAMLAIRCVKRFVGRGGHR